MIPKIPSALVVAMLACACTRQPVETAATLPAAVPMATVPAMEECPKAPVGYQPFPAGVSITLPYHLRSDRIQFHEANGKTRRRVVLEFLEGDAVSAEAALASALKDAGFRSRPAKERPDGTKQIAFTKGGVGTVYLRVDPAVPGKPAHPLAKGELTLDYPVEVEAATM